MIPLSDDSLTDPIARACHYTAIGAEADRLYLSGGDGETAGHDLFTAVLCSLRE